MFFNYSKRGIFASLLALILFSGPAFSISMEKDEVGAFMDQRITGQMERAHIPGAIVLLVKDGRVLFSRGYGVANLEKGVPMDPARTALRVGSISKLFTATAVMQLYERGVVDLDTDIHALLPPGMLREYGAPITLHELLTHTAGVGDKFFGQTVEDPKDLLPLSDYLAQNLAPPLGPPGKVVNYSSMGFALAGLTVETLSGRSFADYVKENILLPLGMRQSGFIPSPEQIETMPAGYKYLFGKYRELPLRHWRYYPSSSFVATGNDIAEFMIAQLEGGSLPAAPPGQDRILKPETVQLMQGRQFTVQPGMPGMAYGFWERVANNQRILWHSGIMPGHRTGFYLFPEQHLGLFIYNNSDFRLYQSFFPQFLDKFFPVHGKGSGKGTLAVQRESDRNPGLPASPMLFKAPRGDAATASFAFSGLDGLFERFNPFKLVQSVARFLAPATDLEAKFAFLGATIGLPNLASGLFPDHSTPPTARYAGHYRNTWYPRTTIGKVAALVGVQGRELTVRNDENGRDIWIAGERFTPVGAKMFQKAGSDQLVSFQGNEKGGDLFLYKGGRDTYQRLHWYDFRRFHLLLLATLLSLYLLSLFHQFISLRGGETRVLGKALPRSVKAERLAALGTSMSFPIFILGIGLIAAGGTFKMMQEISFPFLLVLAVPLLTAAGGIILLLALTQTWRLSQIGRFEKAHHLILLFNTAAMVWFLNYWNLLGYRF